MRFFDIVLSGAAMIAAVAAQATISVNEFPQSGVVAGKTYTITYSPKDQVPTEIILRRGPSGNLDVVGTIGKLTRSPGV
jgi:gamma-glutamyltranspeptidase